MAEVVEVVVPEIGDGITEAFLAQWLKQPGDHVHEGEPIAELMTDKVNTELVAPVTGTIVKLLVEEEDRITIGAVVATIARVA